MPHRRLTAPHATKPVRTHHSGRTVALALGGGGARGLAHIAMLEAFDELGIKPTMVAGTSIGAICGAAYASGISGAEMRAHTREILSPRFGLVRDLFSARALPFQSFFKAFPNRSAILDPVALLDIALPKGVKQTFDELDIPLRIVASDFYNQEQVVFSSGTVRDAVAASMALPVIFQPVVSQGRAMIDGGLTNPLPFDLLTSQADIVVAIDVSGSPVPDGSRPTPTAFEALFSSAFLFERSIVREKLKSAQPDILISAGTSQFQVLDFLKFDDIMAAAQPAKERLKQQLERVLNVETLPAVDDVPELVRPQEEAPEAPAQKPRRGMLRRKKTH